jgi:hypothetical protein
LVGDHHQLGSVQAGGLFRLLAADAKPAELTHIRRFNDPWEAEATSRLRHGDPTVIDEYQQHGRIHSGSRDEVLDLALQAWTDARSDGESVVVMAADHDTVNQMAMQIRDSRVAAGEVEPNGITVGEQTVGIGDEIVTTRNHRSLVTTGGGWVRNGDRWKITHLDPDTGTIRAESLTGRGAVTLPDYYTGEHICLAYAVTVHKAQGVTVDRSVLVVDDRTSHEHLYVGLTRGRHHNQAAVITEGFDGDHLASPPLEAEDVLVGALTRSSGQKSATETLRSGNGRTIEVTPEQAAIITSLHTCRAHSLEQQINRTQRQQAQPPAHAPAYQPAVSRRIDI